MVEPTGGQSPSRHSSWDHRDAQASPPRQGDKPRVKIWRRNRCEKLRTQAVCRSSSNRTDKANLNFSPELYRLIFSPKLNFSPSTKKTPEYSFELFLPLTNLFLTFVVFACFATTRVNMRIRAQNTRDSAQGYIQCMKCIGNPLVRTDGRTDGQSRDYYVTTKISWLDRLPNFLSNGAPLTR